MLQLWMESAMQRPRVSLTSALLTARHQGSGTPLAIVQVGTDKSEAITSLREYAGRQRPDLLGVPSLCQTSGTRSRGLGITHVTC